MRTFLWFVIFVGLLVGAMLLAAYVFAWGDAMLQGLSPVFG